MEREGRGVGMLCNNVLKLSLLVVFQEQELEER